MKSLSKFEGVAYAAMRIIIGFFFACHGAQKILGMFGGVEGKAVPFELSWVFIGGLVELVAGTLIAVGLLTRVAAFMASGQIRDNFAQRIAPRFGVNSQVIAIRLDRDSLWPAS